MTMRNLATPEMIQLSSPILTLGTRQHDALLSVPSAAAALPVLQAATDGLIAVEVGVDLDALGNKVHELTDEHDALASHIGHRLDVEIEHASSDADRNALQQARDQILPPGDNLLRRNVAVKAGEHLIREQRVSTATITLLGTIPLRGGGTLADEYVALQAKTAQLSTADAERQTAIAEQAGPRVRDARKRWVAAVELIDMSMTAMGADPTPVLGAIRAAQARTAPGSEDVATPQTPATTPAVTNAASPTNGAATPAAASTEVAH